MPIDNMQESFLKKYKMKKLISQIRTPDGTVLISQHRHDYVAYTDKSNGFDYALDGGLDYMKISAPIPNRTRWQRFFDKLFKREVAPLYKDISIYDTDTFQQVREKLYRKSSIASGDIREGQWIVLKDMTDAWIKKAIKYNKKYKETSINAYITEMYKKELLYRKEI